MKEKVVVGMSGGVDSSVAAYLLKEQGYEVIGVTMQIWQDEEQELLEENGGCCGLSAVDDARRVAQALDIPYYVMNFKQDFKEHVIDYFIDEYLDGRTPNPCIAKLSNGRYALKRSATPEKDQTYALYNLTQNQLSKTLMPVGEYTKDEIREIAEKIHLPVAHKPDSQDICFVDGSYGDFIEETTGQKIRPGNFVDMDGNILGTHKGIVCYTVGQRRGLGLSLKQPGYVVRIDKERNEVVIGSNEDLMTDTLYGDHVNLMSVSSIEDGMRFQAKVRYNHRGALCTVSMDGKDRIKVLFDEPQRAVTPGQAVVFYDGDYVAGGATIL